MKKLIASTPDRPLTDKEMLNKLRSAFTKDQLHAVRDICTQLIDEIIFRHGIPYRPVLKDTKSRAWFLKNAKETRQQVQGESALAYARRRTKDIEEFYFNEKRTTNERSTKKRGSAASRRVH